MKQALKIIIGLALVAVGVLWILSILGVLTFEFSTKGWWALFVIVPCLFGLVSDKDKIGPCIGIGVGVLLFLAARDVITWQMMWQIALALLIIGFGIRILFFRSWGCGECDVQELKTISRDGKDIRFIDSAFGKQSLTFAGEKFEGADVKSSFGALTLDLRGAVIAGDAFIDLNVGFSGVSIIVPDDINVKIAVSSGFGGVKDDRHSKVDNAGAPTLIITGKVGFGGVEIRN
jgi:predicted membrane protein